MGNIFTSSISGMNAAQIGLATTEHNIANASTPGFTRQQIVLGSNPAQSFGGGFLGQGVNVSSVIRIYDQYLSTQVLQQQTQASYLTNYHTALAQIDNMLSDPKGGMSPPMQDLFSAMNSVANNPESVSARQTLLSNAQSVVNRFQGIDQQLTDMANGLNGQITSSVRSINSYAQQIATLNGLIKKAIAVGQGQQPNDLLDQRDHLINQLNQQSNVTVLQQADGSASVFIGNGQPLVVNEQAMALRAVQSANDPSKIDVAFQNGVNTIHLQQSSLQGGSLSAFLAFRDQSLEPARNALGRVALGLATSFNQQNQLGQDLNGVLGANLFNAAIPRVSQSASNLGTAVVSATISNISGLTTSDYLLNFDGTNYSTVRLSDNAVTNLGPVLPQTVDGFSVNLASGSAMAGDSFLIRPVADAARDISLLSNDPAKIAAAAPMRASAALANLGTATISSGLVNAPPPVNANLQSPVSLTFTSPTTFTVTGAVPAVGGPVTYTPGQDISYNGWTVQITGAPVAGDVFNVATNTNATGDNRNALLMAGFQTINLMANGTASLADTYSQLVGEVGAKTHELDVTSQAQNNMVAQVVASQQSVSGVNLDEEAANLLQYQRAYQAAAKAMQIANTMFDALLALGK
jgi:flagellar hook-associated protein 1 FlgK